jgi:hypothetical protein
MNAARTLFILCSGLLGCGASTAGSNPSFPSSSSGSYGSANSAPSTPGVPAREQVTAGIVVRPDLLCVPFAIGAIDEDADKAVTTAQGIAGELFQKLKAIAPTGTMRMRGVAVAPTYGKSKEANKESEQFALVADGAFEVALTDSMDYWARSKLITALVAASKKEMNARKEPPITVRFETPYLRVVDPEAHRSKLTKQWVERAKAFADATGSGLVLVDCQAPGEIAQRSISNEEVGLTLSVSCRLDAKK